MSSSLVRLCTIASTLFLFSNTSSAGACEAEGFVMNAGRAFTSASQSGSATAFSGAASRYADTRSIALSALGPHRKKLSGPQQEEYVRLARGYMGRVMSKYASRFDATGLKVTGCSGNIINASAAGGRKIIFRVGRGSGGYRLMDVNVSSVWLAAQMRSTFVAVINRNNGDVAALMAYLQ